MLPFRPTLPPDATIRERIEHAVLLSRTARAAAAYRRGPYAEEARQWDYSLWRSRTASVVVCRNTYAAPAPAPACVCGDDHDCRSEGCDPDCERC